MSNSKLHEQLVIPSGPSIPTFAKVPLQRDADVGIGPLEWWEAIAIWFMLAAAGSRLIHHGGCRTSMDAATYRCVPEIVQVSATTTLEKLRFQKCAYDDLASDSVDGPLGIRRAAVVAHHGRAAAARG
jgi:hypothetical protein